MTEWQSWQLAGEHGGALSNRISRNLPEELVENKPVKPNIGLHSSVARNTILNASWTEYEYELNMFLLPPSGQKIN